MSELQEIDVVIAPDGTVRLEVRGVKGPGCEALTHDLEQRLGGVVVERTRTDEHRQQGASRGAADTQEVGEW